MEYKISYQKTWNDITGTCYRQTVRALLSQSEMDNFNNYAEKYRLDKKANTYDKFYLRKVKEGINYTNITTQSHFMWFFKIQSDKRYLAGRNTIINIKIACNFF